MRGDLGIITIDLTDDSVETIGAELDRLEDLAEASYGSGAAPRYCEACWRRVPVRATVCWHCRAVVEIRSA